MKRPLRADEARLWAVVAHTVRPAFGRTLPELGEPMPPLAAPAPAATRHVFPPARGETQRLDVPEKTIEPRRRRRIVRGRDAIDARLDLHGLDQDRARRVLDAFLRRAQDEGVRAVLVITGKGVSGDGVLKRRAPEWLGEPTLASVVAGYSLADRRHGGEGALYVALKARGR